MDTPSNAPKQPGTATLEDYIAQHNRDQEAWRRFFAGIQAPAGRLSQARIEELWDEAIKKINGAPPL